MKILEVTEIVHYLDYIFEGHRQNSPKLEW